MVVFSYEWWWPPFFTERRCACGNYFQCAVENSPTQNMSSSEDCLTLVDVPENRYDDAIHHLRWNFFADEPLNNAIGLCARGESQRELERHCLLTLRQGYSRMLVDKKGAVSEIPSYHKIYIYNNIYISNNSYSFASLLFIFEKNLFPFFCVYLFMYLFTYKCFDNLIIFLCTFNDLFII